MTYRQTFVVEYPSADVVPRFGAGECLGGKLYAMQFSDALEEIQLLREHASADAIEKVDAILAAAWEAAHSAQRRALAAEYVKVDEEAK